MDENQLDEIVFDFDKAIQNGNRCNIEPLIEKLNEPERNKLLGDLIRIELHYSVQNGDSINPDHYRQYGRQWPEFAAMEIEKLRRNSGLASDISEFASNESIGEGTMVVSTATRSEIANGTQIDRYRIIRHLGEGGMGEVYLANHRTFTKRLYAIKFLKVVDTDDNLRQRFSSEIRVMEELKHPNIVFAEDAGQFEDRDYLVMEFVDGIDLKKLVSIENVISVGAAAEIIRQSAEGLQHAYEHHLVHRDLKPSNLMLTSSMQVKILDLGLARDHQSDSDLTLTCQILGTPDYMAPEQWNDTKSVDIRGDIYSLGCTLYCLLCGNPPFGDKEHSSYPSKMNGHISEQPIPVSDRSKMSIPPELESVMNKMLAKAPEDRYQTPAELSKAIAPFALASELDEISISIPCIDIEKEITRSMNSPLAETATKLNTSEDATSAPKLNDRWRVQPIPVILGTLLVGMAVSLFFVFVSTGVDSNDAGDSSKTSDVKQQNNNSHGPSASVRTTSPEFPISVEYFSRKFPELPHDHETQVHFREGKIGQEVFNAHFDEYVKVAVALPKPRHCFLVALNPTADSEFRIQLLTPDSESIAPLQQSSFTYPPDAEDFYQMTDGLGLQSFVLISSDSPLPPFKQWKEQNLVDFPWAIVRKNIVLQTEPNGMLKPIFQDRDADGTRGVVNQIQADPIVRSCIERLQAIDGIDTQMIVFPVHARN